MSRARRRRLARTITISVLATLAARYVILVMRASRALDHCPTGTCSSCPDPWHCAAYRPGGSEYSSMTDD